MKLFSLIALLLLSLSCKDGLFDSGATNTRQVDIMETFTNIEVKNMFDITLIQDTLNKVLITCGRNLQSYVSVSVNKGVLILDQDTKFNWSRKYERIKLELHITDIPTITAYEPLNLKTKGTLKGDQFILRNWAVVNEVEVSLEVKYCGIFMISDNSGYFKIKGKSVSAYIEGWGSCQIRADSLMVTNDCFVNHRGIGDVYVNATSLLGVTIENTGNIYYTGHPSQIVVDQKSTGRLINLDQ